MIQEFLLLQYPACSTCQKAQKWLRSQGLTPTVRHIVDEAPTAEELTRWLSMSGLPISKLFNTSGLVYRALALKDKLPTMSEAEQIALLASNGKLIKRPILISASVVLVGFKPDEWTKALGLNP